VVIIPSLNYIWRIYCSYPTNQPTSHSLPPCGAPPPACLSCFLGGGGGTCHDSIPVAGGGGAALGEELVHERSLAVVDVGDDGNVAQLFVARASLGGHAPDPRHRRRCCCSSSKKTMLLVAEQEGGVARPPAPRRMLRNPLSQEGDAPASEKPFRMRRRRRGEGEASSGGRGGRALGGEEGPPPQGGSRAR